MSSGWRGSSQEFSSLQSAAQSGCGDVISPALGMRAACFAFYCAGDQTAASGSAGVASKEPS